LRAGAAYRISFALGAGGVLACIAAGAVSRIVETGRPPSLMQHPLEPVRDALAVGRGEGFAAEHRMFVAIQARDARVYPRVADALVRSGDDASATEVLERALELRPLPPVVHAMLATLYARQGRLLEAREQARQALAQGEAVRPQLLRKLGLREHAP
jgi:tetratricopeptide (TPR) repeat protein